MGKSHLPILACSCRVLAVSQDHRPPQFRVWTAGHSRALCISSLVIEFPPRSGRYSGCPGILRSGGIDAGGDEGFARPPPLSRRSTMNLSDLTFIPPSLVFSSHRYTPTTCGSRPRPRETRAHGLCNADCVLVTATRPASEPSFLVLGISAAPNIESSAVFVSPTILPRPALPGLA